MTQLADKMREDAMNDDNEKTTDQFVRDMLRSIDINRPWEQSGGPLWKRQALRNGSKSATTTGEGKPEFVFERDGFIVIIEDKKSVQQTRLIKNGVITTEFPARRDYALNGAVHYATTMIRNGLPTSRGVFAVGIAGSESHHEIAVAHVSSEGTIKPLEDLDNLDVFAADQIEDYHGVQVIGRRPHAEIELDGVKQAAARLHEGMRNYGSIENDRKAPLISAILLALRYDYFEIDRLQGLTPGNNYKVWDGRLVYEAAKEYMEAYS